MQCLLPSLREQFNLKEAVDGDGKHDNDNMEFFDEFGGVLET